MFTCAHIVHCWLVATKLRHLEMRGAMTHATTKFSKLETRLHIGHCASEHIHVLFA
jgi:hypothetical protein